MRILLAAPTARYKNYCFKAWADHVKSLTHPVDVLLVDNTADGGHYAKKFLSKYFPVIHIDPKPDEDSYHLICRSQNIIRNFFLKNDYDYLFMLESDQFPPVNVLEYLLSKKKLVASLPYFIGTGFQSFILQEDLEDFGTIRFTKVMNADKIFLEWDGWMKPKGQHGIGCMLIHRSVMVKIKFRIQGENQVNAHSDVYFHEDLRSADIKSWVSEMVFCRHENATWHDILKK